LARINDFLTVTDVAEPNIAGIKTNFENKQNHFEIPSMVFKGSE